MRSDELVISADFGTSGVKVGVVNRNFEILTRTIEAYPLSLPGPGEAEQNPEDWWEAFRRAMVTLSADVPDLADRTKALVFGAQMLGVICTDATGKAIRPGLIWLDKRSAEIAQKLIGGFPSVQGYQIAKIARWLRIANGAPGRNGMDPTGKMLWLKQNEPENFEKSAKLLDVKDWLIHRCTGEFTTTPDSANMTWMMDSRKGKEGWSSVLAKKVGIPISKLPKIIDGSDTVGTLTETAARDLGLKANTLMIAGGSDVTAAAIGSGAVGDGELHINASTSSWISGFFPRRVMNVPNSYATISSSIDFRPLLVASQENAGSVLGWLAQIVDEEREDDLEKLASFYEDIGAPAMDDPFLLPWFAGERAPVDEERLRGTFHGLSLRHDRRAIKRAAIEGIALNIRWAYSKVAREKGVQLSGPIPLVGGAALNNHFAQTLADSINRSVTVGEPRFAGVLGAAAIAAPALGWHSTVWEAAKAIPSNGKVRFDPNPQRVEELNKRNERLELIRKDLVKLYRRKGTEVLMP